MEVKIRFNDTCKHINLNCKNGVILEHVRALAELDPNVILDLCDKDGNVKLLRQNPTAYATTGLAPNETYYLVSAVEENKFFQYTLIANLNKDEVPFEIKPTKADKATIPKKLPQKAPARNRKTK